MARNTFLDNVGLDSRNSLTYLLNACYTATDDEVDLIKHSMFYSEKQYTDLYSRRGGMSIISLCIRSINASYTEFKLLIERLNENNPLTVVCLNECWLESTHNMTDFHLLCYELLCTTEKSCGHGICIIYVYNQFSAKPLGINENIHGWERPLLNYHTKGEILKRSVICNIYKPPNEIADYLNIFIREFSNALSFISNRHHSAFICGDFNIDL